MVMRACRQVKSRKKSKKGRVERGKKKRVGGSTLKKKMLGQRKKTQKGKDQVWVGKKRNGKFWVAFM